MKKLFTFLVFFVSFGFGSIFLKFSVHLHEGISQNIVQYPHLSNNMCNNQKYKKFAIATILTINASNYIDLAEVLGYSITKYSDLDCGIDRILITSKHNYMYYEDEKRLNNAGWNIVYNSPVADPINLRLFHQTQKILTRYVGQFSKLNIFNMTQYDAILYVDSDTIVTGNITELFDVHSNVMRKKGIHLGWVKDDSSMFPDKYNAGVMLIIPSNEIYHQLMIKMHILLYDIAWAEQAFLNTVYNTKKYVEINSVHTQFYELPLQFNVMSSLPATNASEWNRIKHNVRIFHFTWIKPTVWLLTPSCVWMGIVPFCNKWTQIKLEITKCQHTYKPSNKNEECN